MNPIDQDATGGKRRVGSEIHKRGRFRESSGNSCNAGCVTSRVDLASDHSEGRARVAESPRRPAITGDVSIGRTVRRGGIHTIQNKVTPHTREVIPEWIGKYLIYILLCAKKRICTKRKIVKRSRRGHVRQNSALEHVIDRLGIRNGQRKLRWNARTVATGHKYTSAMLFHVFSNPAVANESTEYEIPSRRRR